jgi:hypothetical protein
MDVGDAMFVPDVVAAVAKRRPARRSSMRHQPLGAHQPFEARRNEH